METKVSTKGQVVLPGRLRRKLGILAGDPLDVDIEAGRIILTPRKRRPWKVRIIADSVTGLPVLHAGSDAPQLRSKDVEEILANFP
jgi:AbrB family looped-hinge helix DNA binding protein